ncbi:nuclear transport factor 2 family protein [Maritalea mediterranea]|uniref:Nuclear transport factor 2 family protein n=1 Tax=Maritalea mediterranea TaxID=2909667 RepID=A0ABS9EE29_9HYPH|nr:nuclear transport factor 2 family protein [Maritalea mediterranea]MCF4099663.1 nuclear transport factor 2 family protein [Maritalea mediterranea]
MQTVQPQLQDSPAPTAQQIEALLPVLQDYFDGLYTCDLDIFKRIFHPRAVYATADETPLLYRDMPTYFEVLAQRQSPASRGEERHDVIDQIQFAGANTAFAQVRCRIGTKQFVDFLTLVREGGQWKIMAKIFHIQENN